MPSDQERKDLIQGLLDSGVPVNKLKAAVGSLKSPEQQELFFQTAAQKLGRAYGSPQEPAQVGYQPPEGAKFTPDSQNLTPGQELVKEGLGAIPRIGAAVGGILGGSTAGAASLGVGAVPGAIAGAAAGASLGSSFKDALTALFLPSEAPQTPGAVLKGNVKEAAEGVVQELGGRAIGFGVKGAGALIGAAAKGSKNVAGKLMVKSLPNADKIISKLGGEETIASTAKLLDDYAILSTHSTAGKLVGQISKASKEIGKNLEQAYSVVDEAAAIKYQPKSIVALTVDRLKQITLEQSKALSASDKKRVTKTLLDFFQENEPSHQNMARIARTIGDKFYDTMSPKAAAALGRRTELALRQVNGELAEAAVGDLQLMGKPVMEEIRRLSSTYGTLTTIANTARASLNKSTGLTDMIGSGVKKGLATSVAGLPGLIAQTASETTLAKTSAAAAANYTAKLLQFAASGAPKAKIITNLAKRPAASALLKWHAHELMNNADYRQKFFAFDEQFSKLNDQGETSGPQQ